MNTSVKAISVGDFAYFFREGDALEVVLHGIGDIDRTPGLRADGDLLGIHADWRAHQRA